MFLALGSHWTDQRRLHGHTSNSAAPVPRKQESTSLIALQRMVVVNTAPLHGDTTDIHYLRLLQAVCPAL